MANEIFYMPGVGTRYYYDSTALGTVTLTELGATNWTTSIVDGHPCFNLSGTAFKFVTGTAYTGSHTVEYWINLSGWTNTGTSHLFGNSRFNNLYGIKPTVVSGTNNISLKLFFDFTGTGEETATVTLQSQSGWVHIAAVYEYGTGANQVSIYANGTKVIDHYLQMMGSMRLLFGGTIEEDTDTSLLNSFTGKLGGIIVTAGAKYTSSFTPAWDKVNVKNLTEGGDKTKNFTAPEIEYLDVDSILYKLTGSGSAVEEDNTSITKNASDKLQTVGVIDQNSGNAIKKWTGTKAEYIALGTPHDANTDYEVIDDNGLGINVADNSLSNLTNAGKIVGAGLGMPSNTYDNLTLGASGTTYTAPADGWFTIAILANNVGEVLFMAAGGLQIQTQAATIGAYVQEFIPCKKGQQMQVQYSTTGAVAFFRFVYAEGSKSEAN